MSLQRYLPYGGLRVGGAPTDRQFTGQRRETTLGFYDYVARQYDPALGRFLQADSIVPNPRDPQSLNRYSYVNNNPLRYVDPTGHFSQEQLNWMGYYKDTLSADIWEFLLLAEPDDYMLKAPGGDIRQIMIGSRGAASSVKYGLFACNSSSTPMELLDWLGSTDVRSLVIGRTTYDGFKAWTGLRPPIPHVGQIGSITDSSTAAFNRMMGELTSSIRDGILKLTGMPEPAQEGIGKALDVVGVIDIGPGCLDFDIRMKFLYYDGENELMYVREMWLRPDAGSGLARTIHDSWLELPTMFPDSMAGVRAYYHDNTRFP